MSNLHSIYMGLAMLGILIYYPVATFFYPNFQFLDKSLDLKYNPSFTVLVLQGKILKNDLKKKKKREGRMDNERKKRKEEENGK